MSTNTTNNSIEKRPPTKVDALKSIMANPSIQEQFKNAMGEKSGIFTASLIDLFASDTYLQNCEPKLVVMEALKAAVLNLPINKALGFSYIVPFQQNVQENGQWVKKQVPQMQIGYKGYLQLAMRTGQYRTINADKIFEGELQRVDKLTGEFDLSGTRTGDEVEGYFAHIVMLNGFTKTLFMSKSQIIIHAKKYAKSFGTKGGPWEKEFDSMAIKTVLRNLLTHYGFLSVEMMGAVSRDIEQDTVEDIVAETINENANRQEMKFDEIENIEPEPEPEQKDDCPI